MPKKQARFTLPVKPHIRKFIHVLYGYPFKIDNKNQLGIILQTLLEKRSYVDSGLNAVTRKKRLKQLTATVECFAALYRLKEEEFVHVPEHQVIMVNRLLEKEFERELYVYVKNNVGPSGRYPGYMEAYRGFMEEYHICEEIDMQLDTLKKIEYRHRQKVESNRKKLIKSELIS